MMLKAEQLRQLVTELQQIEQVLITAALEGRKSVNWAFSSEGVASTSAIHLNELGYKVTPGAGPQGQGGGEVSLWIGWQA